jgi:hypothetical protein
LKEGIMQGWVRLLGTFGSSGGLSYQSKTTEEYVSSGAVERGTEIETLHGVVIDSPSICFLASAVLFVLYCSADDDRFRQQESQEPAQVSSLPTKGREKPHP